MTETSTPFLTHTKPTDSYGLETDSAPLSQAERGCLIFYESACTTLTILLNSYLIYVVLVKLHVLKNYIYVPVLAAGILGLFHGICCDLFTAMSLINRDWVGSLDWCGTVALLHKYIVYCIIYCQIVVSFEVAYFVSHPSSYSRTSEKTRTCIALATSIAILLNFPIMVCQFFYIKPSNIWEVYPDIAEYSPQLLDNFYYYDKLINICYRFYYPGTLDYNIIINYVLVSNITAVLLVILSYAVIVRVVLRSRSMIRLNLVGSESKLRTDRYKKQNKKIAVISILTTSLVLLPWFPTLVICIIDGVDNFALQNSLGTLHTTRLRRASQYLFYLLPWVFPLMTIIGTPAISRASKNIIHSLNHSDHRGHHGMKMPISFISAKKSKNGEHL